MSLRTYHSPQKRVLNWRSKAHHVHTDIQPVVSAIKHGKRRIAQQRYNQLCLRLNLMTWEASVVGQLIRDVCAERNIRLHH